MSVVRRSINEEIRQTTATEVVRALRCGRGAEAGHVDAGRRRLSESRHNEFISRQVDTDAACAHKTRLSARDLGAVSA